MTWRYGGLREVQQALLRRARRLYHRRAGLLFEADLAELSQAPPPAGVEVRVLADCDDVSNAGALTTRALGRIRSYMTPGNTCFIAWRGERPVGFAWISEPGTPHESLPLPIPADVVYGWDLWVDPRQRGHGVGSALVRARLAYARERGFVRSWRIVMDGNEAALRTLERSSTGSARVLGQVVYETVLGRMRVRYEPALRQVPLGTSIATSAGPGGRGGVSVERS
jgi:ribosomal protein S18 acetylase RimI-like enzyme